MKRRGRVGEGITVGAKALRYGDQVEANVPEELYEDALVEETPVVEEKLMDVSLGAINVIASTVNTNTNVYLLNGIPSGSSFFNRVGRYVTLKEVHVHSEFRFFNQPEAGTGETHGLLLRVVLVWDERPGGVIPPWNVMFREADPVIGTVATILSQENPFQGGRFRILHDQIIRFQPTFSSVSSPGNAWTSEYVDFTVPLNGAVSQYSGTGSTVADVATGALYLGLRASANTSTQSCETFFKCSRLKFYDGVI